MLTKAAKSRHHTRLNRWFWRLAIGGMILLAAWIVLMVVIAIQQVDQEEADRIAATQSQQISEQLTDTFFAVQDMKTTARPFQDEMSSTDYTICSVFTLDVSGFYAGAADQDVTDRIGGVYSVTAKPMDGGRYAITACRYLNDDGIFIPQ